MNIEMYNQIYNLFIFFIVGIVIGILFDFFRIVRRIFKTPDIITYLEDIVFWILVGLILLSSIFIFHNGEIRGYIFIGIIIGIVIYALTISKYFVKINVKLLKLIKNIVYIPLKTCFHFFNKIIFKPIKNGISKLRDYIEKVIRKSSKNTINYESIDNFDKIKE